MSETITVVYRLKKRKKSYDKFGVQGKQVKTVNLD